MYTNVFFQFSMRTSDGGRSPAPKPTFVMEVLVLDEAAVQELRKQRHVH